MRDEHDNPSTDRWLDAALKQYGEAEPRAGLENRVLASLQAERERRRSSLWWWRPAAALTIALLAGGTWLLRRSPDVTEVTSSNLATVATESRKPEPTIASSVRPNTLPQKPVRRRPENHIDPRVSALRLEQFPAPAPLSEQEEMLAQYVREHRREATMVARARAEILKQELEQFMQPSPSEQPKDLEQ